MEISGEILTLMFGGSSILGGVVNHLFSKDSVAMENMKVVSEQQTNLINTQSNKIDKLENKVDKLTELVEDMKNHICYANECKKRIVNDSTGVKNDKGEI